MKGSKDVLSSIVKTAQMGQIGIRSVLNAPIRANLKTALRSQLREYDSIEREGLELANARGWDIKQQDPGIQRMTNMMTKVRLSYGNVSSKAAAMRFASSSGIEFSSLNKSSNIGILSGFGFNRYGL